MASLYADEQFPKEVVAKLRLLGHDVLTVQEAGNRGDSDEQVVEFAAQQNRIVLTLNRRDFIRIHRQVMTHAGIIVCKQDHDWTRLTNNVDQVITGAEAFGGKLIRIVRKSEGA